MSFVCCISTTLFSEFSVVCKTNVIWFGVGKCFQDHWKKIPILVYIILESNHVTSKVSTVIYPCNETCYVSKRQILSKYSFCTYAGVHLGGRLGTDEEAGCPGPELVDVVHGGHVSSAPAAAHLCPHNLCSQCCQGDSGPLSLSVHTTSPAQPPR